MKKMSLEEARLQLLARRAGVAVILTDPKAHELLLKVPDAVLGRLLKNRLCEIVGVATTYGIDLALLRANEKTLHVRVKRASKKLTVARARKASDRDVEIQRYSLVLQGQLLRAHDFCNSAGITERKLAHLITSGRIFSVRFDSEPFYPAFFLSNLISFDNFRKVIRRLGETSSWAIWGFFTTPSETLDGMTPLQYLAVEDVKPVVKAATKFAAGYAPLSR